MTRHHWTSREVSLLREHYPNMSTAELGRLLGVKAARVYAKASQLGLKKSEAYLASEKSGRIQRGKKHPSMMASQFKPGMTPWNKGKAYQAGGRSVQTQFKPGQRSANWRPVGSYRINSEGYLDVKVSDTGYPPRDWKGVHRIVWEQAHGPVPKDSVVVFKPGQRTNVLEQLTLERLECISRAEIARRNHPKNRSPEYARLVQIKGAITRQVNRIAKEHQA